MKVKQVLPTALALASGVSAAVKTANECETYSKGDAEVTLCYVNSFDAEDGSVIKHEATLENTGKALVCDLKVEIENADEAYATWPQFMTERDQKGWEVNFSQDQVWNIGAAFDASKEITSSIRVLDGFRDCAGGKGGAGKMKVTKNKNGGKTVPVKPVVAAPVAGGKKKAMGGKNKTEKKDIPASKIEEEIGSDIPATVIGARMAGGNNNDLLPSVRAAGQCEKYTAEGDAEVTLCYVDSFEADNGIVKHEATIENTGKALVCDLKIEIENADEAYATWPQFMTEQKGWEVNFSQDQVWNVGGAFDADIQTSIRVVDGFRACGEGSKMINDVEVEGKEPVLIAPVGAAEEETVQTMVSGGVRLAGECEKYTQGDAEVTLCFVDKFNADNGVVKHEATIENTGTTFVCNLKLNVDNSEEAFATWPQFMTEQEGWVQNFPQDAIWNVGAALPEGTDTRIEVVSFDDCSIESSVGKEKTAGNKGVKHGKKGKRKSLRN